MGCIVSDLRKEYDYINHGILLLSKLEQYRIIGKFKAWLNPTSQRDTIHTNANNNSYSSWELVKHGIPQGAILGPLFFHYL